MKETKTMKMDSSNIEHYFKGIGCSFEQKQDELKISRFVNGGDFIRLGFYFIFVLFVLSSIFLVFWVKYLEGVGL